MEEQNNSIGETGWQEYMKYLLRENPLYFLLLEQREIKKAVQSGKSYTLVTAITDKLKEEVYRERSA